MKYLSESMVNKYCVKNPKPDEIENILQRHVKTFKKEV